jgi:hypothetical protein
MVEKLKNEIAKLESRIRYKDLDMSNLTVENSKLQQFVDKYKIITNILKIIQNKELFLVDKINDYSNIISNPSREFQKIKLNEILFNIKLLKDKLEDPKFDMNLQLSTINQPMLTRLVTDKDTKINSEFLQYNKKITTRLDEIKSIEEFIQTFIMFGTGMCAIIGGLFVYYFLL